MCVIYDFYSSAKVTVIGDDDMGDRRCRDQGATRIQLA